MRAIPLNETDGSLQPAAWDAQTRLDTHHRDYTNTSDSRTIITYEDSANNNTSVGKPFTWNDLNQDMRDMLHKNAADVPDGQGEARLLFLRGDNANEGKGNNYRQRIHLLGDIIHSAPFYVGAPPFPDVLGNDYSAFYNANLNRTPMIYVGANDGMLHAFNSNTGNETLPYVPYTVFKNLSQLTSPVYSHRYYVDGTPTVEDARGSFGTSRCGAVASCWRSILVSGLRQGGQGVFALDVTSPSAFQEANASKLVLWEFTDIDDADLGYTYSQPSIVKMANNKWAAVFGNGYNNTEADGNASTTGNAVLYIVFLEGGIDGVWTADTDYIKIDTGVGETLATPTPNGLATPAAVDIDSDFITDYIYAGDLRGNVWKFDVTDVNPQAWKSSSTRLFTATTATGPQPITVRPEVGRHFHSDEGIMVYVGTGKYLETSDNSLTGPKHIMYALWDKLGTTTPTILRSELLQQEVLPDLTTVRVTSNKAINWDQHMGWYIDLPDAGERYANEPSASAQPAPHFYHHYSQCRSVWHRGKELADGSRCLYR
ncbi:hypothetical protein C2W62_28390 [Candidatus Entotheonella serta]|nr:hypothetical protein C2W62_28390 [Candidatus Entotheonella serta]